MRSDVCIKGSPVTKLRLPRTTNSTISVSKYTVPLLLPCAVAYLRESIDRKGLWASVALATVVLVSVCTKMFQSS